MCKIRCDSTTAIKKIYYLVIMKPILFLLLTIVLISCGSSTEPAHIATPEEQAKIDSIAGPMIKMVQDVDSVLSKIYGAGIVPNITVDSVKTPVPELDIDPLFYPGTGKIVRYEFKHVEGTEFPPFWIIKAEYPTRKDLDSAYQEFQAWGHLGAGKSKVPGLSYANDYVVCANNTVYWLNTGCNTSWENHKKTRALLYRLFDITNPTDSLFCRCGNNCD